MSGPDYNIRGGVACTDAPLRVTHPPRPRRATVCVRVETPGGAAHWGSHARRGRLGTCHRTRDPTTREQQVPMPRWACDPQCAAPMRTTQPAAACYLHRPLRSAISFG